MALYHFHPERGIAPCGLACCLCTVRPDCPGCQAGGCPATDTCSLRNCCHARQLPGCWACPSFPCAQPMLQKIRLRAFCRLAGRYSPALLVKRLGAQAAEGVRYHYPGQMTGDYDQFGSEAEIMAFLFPSDDVLPR